jgi:hypothetical protein
MNLRDEEKNCCKSENKSLTQSIPDFEHARTNFFWNQFFFIEKVLALKLDEGREIHPD